MDVVSTCTVYATTARRQHITYPMLPSTHVTPPTKNLEEYCWGQSYGTGFFLLVSWDVFSADVFKGLLVMFFHRFEHVIHARLSFTHHPATVVGGVEICLHLVVSQLVDDEHQDLTFLGVMLQVSR